MDEIRGEMRAVISNCDKELERETKYCIILRELTIKAWTGDVNEMIFANISPKRGGRGLICQKISYS
jgi:hypothetical protein